MLVIFLGGLRINSDFFSVRTSCVLQKIVFRERKGFHNSSTI